MSKCNSNPDLLTFADWYQFKTGVTLERAKLAGVYDLGLLEEAFNFSNPITNQTTTNADKIFFPHEIESRPEYLACIDALCRMAHSFEPTEEQKEKAKKHVQSLLNTKITTP